VAPETIVIAASVVYIGLVLVMVRLTYHFAAPQPISVTAEWLDELSVETTALLHLVGEKDSQSLRTHLPHLKNDFKLICMAVKVIIVQSKRDRPDLVRVLARNEITFAYRIMMVRLELAWGRFLFSCSRPRP
jgi:hypothetical protein